MHPAEALDTIIYTSFFFLQKTTLAVLTPASIKEHVKFYCQVPFTAHVLRDGLDPNVKKVGTVPRVASCSH